ncbi:MAG TPA: hypothetical protein VKB34_17890 [Povalibacter sp.]|nr:hypothetical protein [Povalibacter sp.]
MAKCTVAGKTKPDSGPTPIETVDPLTSVNRAHPTWNVVKDSQDKHSTVFSSTVATEQQLVDAFSAEFRSYSVTKG